MLHQSGMHSDVGVTEYLKARLLLRFEGFVSSSLLQRASMLSSTGLLKWWSDLINRTDLERNREYEPPIKPAISGNIQSIFYILLAGLGIGLACMVLEQHLYIYKVIKAAFCWCKFELLWIVHMSRNIMYCKILKKR